MKIKDTRIIVNKVQCEKCRDIIESKHRHDFKWCKCGNIAVDGGQKYLKRCGDINKYIELSESEGYIRVVSESMEYLYRNNPDVEIVED